MSGYERTDITEAEPAIGSYGEGWTSARSSQRGRASNPAGAGPGANNNGSLEAGLALLRQSFGKTGNQSSQMLAATEAKNVFAGLWTKADVEGHKVLKVRLAALQAEALIRISCLLILSRQYDVTEVFTRHYHPAVALLKGSRDEADELFALELATAERLNQRSEELTSQLAMSIDQAFQQAVMQRSSLMNAVRKLQDKIDAYRAGRDEVKARLGEEKWRQGNLQSSRAQEITSLVKELNGATKLMRHMETLDDTLTSLSGKVLPKAPSSSSSSGSGGSSAAGSPRFGGAPRFGGSSSAGPGTSIQTR